MLENYHAHGVKFRFPGDWKLSEQQDQGETTITVESPDTSFWSLSLFFDSPAPENVLEAAVDALEQSYEEIDIYPVNAQVCHRNSLARDAEFVCYELINSAFLRAFQTDKFTALVYYQGTDHELEHTRQILESICQSLQCDQDEWEGAGSKEIED